MARDSYGALSELAGIGFTLVAEVLLFTGIGYGLDRLLGTGPWLMIGGVFVGAVFSFIYMVRSLNRATARRRSAKGNGASHPQSRRPRR